MGTKLLSRTDRTEGLSAEVLLDDVLAVDAEVGIAKEATGQYQVMPWSFVACVLVVLVECLLPKDREDHTNASAKDDGDNEVSQMVVSHGSDGVLGSDNECHVVRHHECSCTTTDVMHLL
jgi:hypothetical protein